MYFFLSNPRIHHVPVTSLKELKVYQERELYKYEKRDREVEKSTVVPITVGSTLTNWLLLE